VSLAPSNTELLYAVGAGDAVVAVDDYSNYPAEAKNKPKVGGFAQTNIEQVVALAPDVVLATNIHVKTIVPALEQRGLTVVVIQPSNVAAVLDSVRMVGKIMGKPQKAEELATSLQQRLLAIRQKVQGIAARPKVYVELDPTLYTVGPGSFVADMLDIAGGENIAADAKTQWPQLSNETILTDDPAVIMISSMGVDETPEQVSARPGWQEISAVKNGRVVVLNPDLTNRPGPRVFDGIEEMARIIHPELFR
jgi:iron complex transport system substrate-binding protein